MSAVSPIVNLQRRPIVNSNGQWANRGGVSTSSTLYSNGFAHRLVGGVSRLLLPASHTRFPVLARARHDDLRSVDNDGLVRTGRDFKTESLSGIDYPFHIHTYNPILGRLELIIYMPLTVNQQNLIALYFGKDESDLEDLAGSWGNKALAVYHLPSDQDFSGNGRHLSGDTSVPTGYSYTLQLSSNNRTVPNTTGADIWAPTWAANGNVYATFGDGPNTNPASCGLARLTGTTVAGLAAVWLVGGPSPSEADHWDPIAGYSGSTELLAKCTSLIAYGTDLYLWLADDDNERGWTDCRIGKVALGNIAAGPTVPSWGMGGKGTVHTWKTINPCWLQCGQGLAAGWDAYVYAFPQHYAPVDNLPGDSPSHNPAQFYLIRCLKANNWQTQGNWEWWTGGTDSSPTWGSYANREPRITMTGQCDWRPSAHYIPAPVDRCIFRVGRTGDPDFGGGSMSRFGTWMAQRPWHDWTLIGDKQYTASGIDPDLAQVSAIPNTITIAGDGSVSWLDTTWGGDNTDRCIATKSLLTPV